MAQPLFKRIVGELNEFIVGRGMRPGDRLPSEKELSRHFHVAIMTLRKAVSELVAEGKLERVQGSGTYLRRAVVTGAMEGMEDFFAAPPLIGNLRRRLVIESADRQPHQAAFWRAAISEFEKRHPALTVEVRNPSAEGGHGRDFDVTIKPWWSFGPLLSSGIVRPIAVPPERYPLPFAAASEIGAPVFITMNFLIANVELAKKHGLVLPAAGSFDEFVRFIGKAARSRVELIFETYRDFPLLAAGGDDLVTSRGQRRAIENVAPLLRTFARHREKIEYATGTLGTAFTRGKCLLRSVTISALETMKSGFDFEWKLLPLPRTAGTPPRGQLWIAAAAAASEHPGAAGELVRFLAGDRVQELVVEYNQNLPVTRSAREKFVAKNRVFGEFEPVLFDLETPGPDTVAMHEFASVAFRGTFTQIIDGEIDVEAGLAEIRERAALCRAGKIGWATMKSS